MRRNSKTLGRFRSAGSSPQKLSHDSLERWKSISTIASAIAIPFVLAIVGYFIQRQIVDEGLKKDYVSIAANILKENAANQEPDLRKWAVLMLETNSPIPLSGKAKEGLEKGDKTLYVAIAPPRMPLAPSSCLMPPKPDRVVPYLKKLKKKYGNNREIEASEMLAEYNRFLKIAISAEIEADIDRASLRCLQKYAALINQFSEETAKTYKEPPYSELSTADTKSK